MRASREQALTSAGAKAVSCSPVEVEEEHVSRVPGITARTITLDALVQVPAYSKQMVKGVFPVLVCTLASDDQLGLQAEDWVFFPLAPSDVQYKKLQGLGLWPGF